MLMRTVGVIAAALSLLCVESANATLASRIDWLSNVAGEGTTIRRTISTDTNQLISIEDTLAAGLGSATVQTDYGVHKAVVDTESYADGDLIYQSSAATDSRWDDTSSSTAAPGPAQ